MTMEQRAMAEALGACTFPPATSQKRFALSMAAHAVNKPDTPITDKQDRYLRILVYRFRRQIPARIVELAGPDPSKVELTESHKARVQAHNEGLRQLGLLKA